MAKISAYVPEPSQQYSVQNQRQILEAINTIKDQLNFGYQQDLVNEQAAFLQFMYGNQSGVFNPAYASAAGIPYLLAVSEGLIPGVSPVNIFGFSDNVGTTASMGGQQVLWELTGTQAWNLPSSAGQITLVSSSASDNTRATVLISGVDSSWNILTESKTLNGTSNVTTTGSFLRINSIILTVPGTSQTTNVGTITAKIGGVISAQINPGIGRTQHSAYAVPNGYTYYLNNINAYSGDANGTGYVNYKVQATNNDLTYPTTYTVLQTTWQLNFSILRTNPYKYTQKTDVKWEFSVNNGTHNIGLISEGILVAN